MLCVGGGWVELHHKTNTTECGLCAHLSWMGHLDSLRIQVHLRSLVALLLLAAISCGITRIVMCNCRPFQKSRQQLKGRRVRRHLFFQANHTNAKGNRQAPADVRLVHGRPRFSRNSAILKNLSPFQYRSRSNCSHASIHLFFIEVQPAQDEHNHGEPCCKEARLQKWVTAILFCACRRKLWQEQAYRTRSNN